VRGERTEFVFWLTSQCFLCLSLSVNHVTLAHEDNSFTSLPHLSPSSQKLGSAGISFGSENDTNSKYKPSEEKVQPDTASVMHRHETKNGISKRLYFSATFPIAGATVSYRERRLLSPEPITLEERSSTWSGFFQSTRTGGLGCPTGGSEAGFCHELGRLR
jgi:hypothetical protein